MIRNNQIADLFDEIADLLDLQQENPFRIRAYRNAARLLRGLQREVADMLAKGEDLAELPGIGADLAGKIRDVVETGGTELLFRLRRELPHGLVELLRVPGLGPKRAKLLHDTLHIASLAGLRAAARAGKLEQIKGLGAKMQATILAATEAPTQEKRILRWRARAAVESLLAHLKAAPGVKHAAVAGSYRRARETIGDLDIVATAEDGAAAIAHFIAHEDVAKVLAKGATKASVKLRDGLQVDLRVSLPKRATAPPWSISPAARRTTSRSAAWRSSAS